MNEIFTKCLKEVARVIIAAILAAVGLESAGCIACGDSASSAFVSYGNSHEGVK